MIGCTPAKLKNESKVSAKVIRVVDGDTIIVRSDQPPDWLWGKKRRIRLIDIDTPELKGACDNEIRLALDAKAYVMKKIKDANYMVQVEPVDIGMRRLLARVYVDGVDLGKHLKDKGIAEVFIKRRRDNPWCKF